MGRCSRGQYAWHHCSWGGNRESQERLRGSEVVTPDSPGKRPNTLAALDALHAAGLLVVGVNPRQARDVAKAAGQLAKTDTLDALLPMTLDQPLEGWRR